MTILLEAESTGIDWGHLIFVFLLCASSFWLIIFPVGRMLEDFTKERAVRYIWVFTMGFTALFVFIAMSGVGEVVNARAEQYRSENSRGEVKTSD